MKKTLKLLFLFTLLLALTKVTSAQSGDDAIVSIKSFLSVNKVSPGNAFNIAVKTIVKDGWHINSNKPNEDFLIPTKLTIINTGKGFFNLAQVLRISLNSDVL